MALQAPQTAPAWAHDFARLVEQRVQELRGLPVLLPSFVVADLPDAAEWVNCWILISNETGGAVPAFSDGAAWRRCTDRNVAS